MHRLKTFYVLHGLIMWHRETLTNNVTVQSCTERYFWTTHCCSVHCILVSLIKLGGVHSQYISQGLDHIKKPGQKPREWLVDDSSNVELEVLGSRGTAVELVAHISRGTHAGCPSAEGNKSTAPLLLLFFNVSASHTAEMYQFWLDTLWNTEICWASRSLNRNEHQTRI